MAESPVIGAVAPWFGCNRMLAPAVGQELKGCKWVGVPFAGGMPELAHIKASTIVVSDVHRHVINLARVMAHERLGPMLYRKLRRQAFHQKTLEEAQDFSAASEPSSLTDAGDFDLWAAYYYFISQWMGRSGKAGTNAEFKGNLPIRWSASGGDSNKRYRSAVSSILAFRRILARCNFNTLDVFEFLSNVKDERGHGLYIDPPFPGVGGDYKHKFTEEQHTWLASKLHGFLNVRIVCRFYDHPLIRRLYPEGDRWTWRRLRGRDQANNAEKAELLIINGHSYGVAA